MPVKVYLDEDADLLDLQNKVCAVFGFGSQGHAHALNLTDSGIEVVVGLYQGSKSIPIAQQYGFRVLDVADAAQKADVIFFATPKEVDVVMVAPKAPGHIVRRQYAPGKSSRISHLSTYNTYMNFVRKKSTDAVTSSAATRPLEGQNDKLRELQISPLAAVQGLVTGRFAADIVGVAAELGLADQIQSGPKTAEEIAAALGLHAPSLYRLLRALANFGVFVEQEDGRFGQTPMSDTFRSDVPYSMRGMSRMNFRPWTMRAWTELGHTVRTGTPAFEHTHGMQMFEYLTQHPEEMEIFVAAMRSFTVETGAAVSEAYDFSSIGTLADIGGSQGLVLSIILTKYPLLQGTLFDLPIVIEGAPKFLKSRGVEHRVELRAGSFFESVPSGADTYLLKHILHDWSDADSVRILKTIQAAAKPGAKLLVVEAIVEDSSEPQFAKTLDIWMLAHLRGKERTLPEWQNLLSAGGFRLSRTIPTTSFASVIEAIRE